MSRKLTTEEFIERAKKIHGNKYDYSESVYKNTYTKLKIICHLHREFHMTPSSHLQGQKCIVCSRNNSSELRRNSLEHFVNKSQYIHKNKYDYSKVVYGKNRRELISIICPFHGEFLQTPREHLAGYGCVKCGIEKNIKTQSKSVEKFIEESRKIHGTKYDYSKVVYENSHVKVKIICSIHGEFLQRPSDHLKGHKCPQCAQIEKHINNGFKWKSYIFPTGNEVKVQGYECLTINYLISSSISPNDIKVRREEKPVILYEWSGSTRRYFPDCLLDTCNTIVETKSTYTWTFQKEQNFAKIKGSIESGYNIRVIVWDRNHSLVSDIIYTKDNFNIWK
jgi:hypothetical protein